MRLPKSSRVPGTTYTDHIDSQSEPLPTELSLKRQSARRRECADTGFGLKLLRNAIFDRYLDDGTRAHELAAWKAFADQLRHSQPAIIVERTLREIAANLIAETRRNRGFNHLPRQAD